MGKDSVENTAADMLQYLIHMKATVSILTSLWLQEGNLST